MKLIILFFLLFLSILTFAQSDTIFETYSSSQAIDAYHYHIQTINQEQVILMRNHTDSTSFPSILVTDELGQIKRKKDFEQVGQYNLIDVQYLISYEDQYVLGGNAYNTKGAIVFLSFTTDTHFQSIRIIDSFQIEPHLGFSTNKIKRNVTTGYYESFGWTLALPNTSYKSNYYLAIQPNGQIVHHQPLTTLTKSFYIIDFVWMPVRKQYYINQFFGSLLLSEQLELINDFPQHMFHIETEGITTNELFRFQDCILTEKETIVCSARTNHSSIYQFVLCELTFLVNNTFSINIKPILEEPINDGIIITQLHQNAGGEYIATAQSSFKTEEQDHATGYRRGKSHIYIAKYSADLDREWFMNFTHDKENILRHLTTNQQNNIYIVGEHIPEWPEWDWQGSREGFLLKIFDDGTLTSTPTTLISPSSIKVYPNPTTHTLYVDLSLLSTLHKSYQIVLKNIQGQLIHQKNLLDSSLTKVAIPTKKLPTGLYLLSIEEEGFILEQHKVVIIP